MSALQTLKDELENTLAEVAKLEKANQTGKGNKASERRIRKHTLNLARAGKAYRDESLDRN